MNEAVYELLRAKAEFCLRTGIQPSEYDAMTDDERDVFIEVANEMGESDG